MPGNPTSFLSPALRMPSKLLPLVLWLLWTAPPADAETPSEYQVKAAFLYKFARFIEWPAASFADTASPLIIGILGKDPFGPMLDQAIAGKLVKGRPLQVVRFSRLDQPPRCHILFVGQRAEPDLAQLFALLGNRSVLSVGDSEDFAQAGGMIRLLVSGQHVLFEINTEAAQRAGLKISSQLLKLVRTSAEGR
jgi:hypothetical protein